MGRLFPQQSSRIMNLKNIRMICITTEILQMRGLVLLLDNRGGIHKKLVL